MPSLGKALLLKYSKYMLAPTEPECPGRERRRWWRERRAQLANSSLDEALPVPGIESVSVHLRDRGDLPSLAWIPLFHGPRPFRHGRRRRVAVSCTTGSRAADGGATSLVDYYDGARAWDLREHEIALGIWTAAARYGDHRAIRRLGELFEQGTEVTADKDIAYYWFSVSARGGNEASRADAARIALGMSPEAVAELDRKVAEWQPGPLPINADACKKASPSRMPCPQSMRGTRPLSSRRLTAACCPTLLRTESL